MTGPGAGPSVSPALERRGWSTVRFRYPTAHTLALYLLNDGREQPTVHRLQDLIGR